MSRSTAGEDKDTTVNGVCGGDFEVVTLEVHAAPEVVDGVHGPSPSFAPDGFVGTETTYLWILEGSKNGGQETLAGPVDVVVDKDSNRCFDERERVADLSAFVSNCSLSN